MNQNPEHAGVSLPGDEGHVLPKPPYMAVIFVSLRRENDHGYAEMAARMEQLAQQQEGFLGLTHARVAGKGITISYWTDRQAIRNWKSQVDHLQAQKLGRLDWYETYMVQIAEVGEAYNGP